MDELEEALRRRRERRVSEMMEGAAAPAEPVEVTDENLARFLQEHRLVVVDLWAEWCAPCRAIAPIMKELAKELQGKVLVGKMNVDFNPTTPASHGVMGIPTLLLFKEGKLVNKFVGAAPKAKYIQMIQEHL